MLTTVYFNNNLFFKTSEIENIILEWMLSAKFQAAHLPAAQHPPEFLSASVKLRRKLRWRLF